MKKIIILIPVYNDWESVFKLIKNIDIQISEWKNALVSILIINDGSTTKRPKLELLHKNIKSIHYEDILDEQTKLYVYKKNFIYIIYLLSYYIGMYLVYYKYHRNANFINFINLGLIQ